MSPAGIGRPAASVRVTVFASVTSWWTTAIRRSGANGASAASAAAIDRWRSSSRAGVEANGASASTTSDAYRRSHWSARSSAGWSNPSSARTTDAAIPPCARRTAGAR